MEKQTPANTRMTSGKPAFDRLTPWLQVIGSFCLNVNTWGLLGTFGVFQTFYSNELLRESSDSAISWIGSVQAFFMFVVSFLIGPIFDAGHLQSLLWVGTLLSILGFFMTSLCSQYWQLFLAQGVTMGIGFGCLYLPAPALVSMHFQRHQALAMGISSSGTGIGAVIFSLTFTQLEPRIGFGWATRVLAFILLVTSIIPLALMRFPEKETLDPEADATATTATAEGGPTQQQQPQTKYLPTLKDAVYYGWFKQLIDTSALRDWPFILMIGGLLTTFMGIYTMLYYINLLAAQRTSTPSNVTHQALTMINAASTLGRILPSALADRVGPTHVLAVTALLSSMLTFALLAVRSTAGLIPWTVAFGSISGAFMGLPGAGVFSISNSRDNIGARLGVVLGVVGCGVLIAEPIAGVILDGRGSWPGLAGWSGSLMFVGSAFMVAARVTRAGVAVKVKL